MRKKPWYRARNIILLVLLLAVGVFAVHAYRSLTAVPGSSVDYGQKLVELSWSAEPGATEADNAMPLLARAIERQTAIRQRVVVETGIPLDRLDFEILWSAPNGGEEADREDYLRRRAAAERLLAAYREEGVYDLLAEACAKKVHVRPKHEGRLIDVMLPELGSYRHFSRALNARMRLARQAGDAQEFAASFAQNLELARVLSTEPILISQLVALANTQSALEVLRETIVAGKASPEMLHAVARVMDSFAGLKPLSLAIKGEHNFVLDIIQWTHTDDGHGDGRRIVAESAALAQMQSGARPHPVLNLASPLYPSKKEITAAVEEMYREWELQSDMTPAARRADTWNPDVQIQRLPWNYDLLRVILPALNSAVRTNDRTRSDLVGMRVLVGLELYRAEHGSLPARLDELVPKYISTVPADPYATAGAMRYRILDSVDAAGRSYLLYFVGEDGSDDKGVQEPDDLYRLGATTPTTPFDRVINRVPSKQ